MVESENTESNHLTQLLATYARRIVWSESSINLPVIKNLPYLMKTLGI